MEKQSANVGRIALEWLKGARIYCSLLQSEGGGNWSELQLN